jgi:hypothetical protein
MSKSSVKFWIILLIAVLMAALSIGLVLKIAKVLIWLLVLLILTPIFYVLLRLVLPKSLTTKHDKLKSRD